MSRLTTSQKVKLQARLSSFDFTGLDYKLTYNITRHFRSFVGRDFKACSFSLGTPYVTRRNEGLVVTIKSKFAQSCEVMTL